ncbi:hypothetical protein [Proteus sp. G2615]|uniref:hypothetical protein n=1 Tax=Proteus sp. G2615 TaxID=2698845 RepID=UPI0013779932|nr:hypothetical protein [Proteus sp. G2615]NBN75312.1 hypothetical protein [Proteus sp. G2615]
MKSFNDEIYWVLSAAEPVGINTSDTVEKILNVAKNHYQNGNESEKKAVIDKIESLKKEPLITFPENYLQIIS